MKNEESFDRNDMRQIDSTFFIYNILHFKSCNLAMYLPKMSNSILTTVPT